MSEKSKGANPTELLVNLTKLIGDGDVKQNGDNIWKSIRGVLRKTFLVRKARFLAIALRNDMKSSSH